MCFEKVMSIDSAKNTYNYSRFYDQNTVCMWKALKIQIVGLVHVK